MTEDEILDEHPDLEKADFPAVYHSAAEAGRRAHLGESAPRWEPFAAPGSSTSLTVRRLEACPRGRLAPSGRQGDLGLAKANVYTVITTDSDFVGMRQRLGWPPKVIHIERCDFPFRVIEDLLRRNAVLITEFDKDESAGVLTLRIPQGHKSRW
jgi:hypothetical protein